MSRKIVSLFVLLILLSGLLAACGATPQPTAAPTTAATQPPAPTAKPAPTSPRTGAGPTDLILATTTSTADSGLLDYILPDFQKQCSCTVKVVAVGSGQAIAIGAKGDADVLLVHSRKSEDKFVADGNAKERFDVMYNDFIVVGPTSDPAKIAGMTTGKDAFTAIATAKAPFVSRGDASGTNTKELSIWATANISPTKQIDWYNSIGQGMGETLIFANEKGAYTLSDRATWVATKDKLPNLTLLVGGNTLAENKDKTLYNPYGVLAVNPDKFPGVNAALAQQFVTWILSVPTQKLIASYGVDKYGQQLFYPTSKQYIDSLSAGQPALKVTGIPTEMSWTLDQLKALPALSVDYTGKDGKTTTYTGVLISTLLDQAGVTGDAMLTFVGSDGYASEVAPADYQGCVDCIVAFDPAGGLRSVEPKLPGNAQVSNLVEIQVKVATAPAAGGVPENAVLKFTGKVPAPIGWTADQLKALGTIDVSYTDPKTSTTTTYTGVPFSKLLEAAQVPADAVTLTLLASDGYSTDLAMTDLQGCADCIVAFDPAGGLRSVEPKLPGKAQVKNLVEIQVK